MPLGSRGKVLAVLISMTTLSKLSAIALVPATLAIGRIAIAGTVSNLASSL